MPETIPQTVARLKDGDELCALFPLGYIPVRSMLPVRISEDENFPLCYVADPEYLTKEQVQSFAEQILQRFDDCNSIDQAIEYVQQGIPLSVEHFTGVMSSNLAALSLIMEDDFDENL